MLGDNDLFAFSKKNIFRNSWFLCISERKKVLKKGRIFERLYFSMWWNSYVLDVQVSAYLAYI